MTLHRIATASVLTLAVLVGAVQGQTVSPTLNDLESNFGDISANFGGAGTINSVTNVGSMIEYDLTLGTTDYGKTPIGVVNNDVDGLDIGSDLSAFTEVGYYIQVVSADTDIEFNPFYQDDDWAFVQDFSGTLSAGDSAVVTVAFDAPSNMTDVKGLGFQLFTAGGLETPPANNVTLRVAPVPEPATMLVLGLGGAVVAWKKRR